jgi:aminoglycoside 2'-N-acetyltransferase I
LRRGSPGSRVELTVAHSSALDARTLATLRALLLEVFPGCFSEHDWEHALGGVHAILAEDGEPIGHAAVVQRRLLHEGRALRAGYVEGVGVRADRRGRRHGATLMEAVEQVVRGAYDLGALGASDAARSFYEARGWQRWRGMLSALTPDGVRRCEGEQENLYAFACDAPLDVTAELTCDWRDGALW